MTSALLLAAGCTGTIGAAGSTGAGGGVGTGSGGDNIVITPPPTSLPAESACTSGSPGPRLLRRLSAPELTATIGDLFHDPTAPVATVFNDPPILGFTVDTNALLVQGLGAQQLMDNAEQVAHWAVANHLADLTACTSATDATCRQTFIRSFGKRAFRAPLSDARLAAYDALFTAESSFSDGVEAVVTAMLQSPYFVYRGELGVPGAAPGAPVALTPYEVATSLAYLLTGSMPDDQLLAAADAGALSTPDAIDQQAQRLLADPRSDDMLMRFVTGWFGLDRLTSTVKDDTVFMLTDALRADMLGETRALVVDTFGTGGGVSALLLADHSFLTAPLAQFYGMGSGGLGAQPTRVPYPAGTNRDPGILAHASLLTGYATAGTSSPTQRGKLIRTRLLCQTLPPMPNNLDVKLKPPTQAETTRAHYLEHEQNEPCAGCHKMMDPVGFGFEHYDAFGRRRDQDNGFPVDSSGTIFGMNGAPDVTFDGVSQLAGLLAANDDVKACMVRYWSYYAYGSASWSQDACTYQAVQNDAAGAQFAMRAVLLGIIHAPHFTSRVQDP
jgi:Protein of unknown function (DUF1592)/Protein of unknown function (DUF1588)/Protein of unknown function (DUF1595)/Protein of unknown function (DUF1587)/Protein of unknown function (DUF1585)